MTEEELLLKVIAGDRKAFTSFYDLFQAQVFRTAYGFFHSTYDAEEITQDVFVEAYRSATRFKHKSKLSTWLYRITMNKCHDKLRFRKSVKRFSFLSAILLDENKSLRDTIPDVTHHGIEADQKETAMLIRTIMNKLPENQKTAFVLTQIEELSGKETAEIMNSTPKAIESLIQRAKVTLRKELGKMYEEQKEIKKISV